jgi:hypothetical protein
MVGLVLFVYSIIMKFHDHSETWLFILILVFALFKVLFFNYYTLNNLQSVINRSSKLGHVFFVFGILVILISFSFATDFTCLSYFDQQSFNGINHTIDTPYWLRFLDYFYLSTVTFTSLGFGDIVPASPLAKLLIIMEVIQSFLLIIFGLTTLEKKTFLNI